MSVTSLLVALALVAPAVDAPSAPSSTSEWKLRSPAPGAPPCRAVKFGDEVDTQLIRSNDGHMVLVAGYPGWEHNGDPVEGRLSIDGSEPVSITGVPIGSVFMVLVTKDALAKRIMNARTLRWFLPWGEFTADVVGLGAAFDSIGICPGK
jgi:hypothetical protein